MEFYNFSLPTIRWPASPSMINHNQSKISNSLLLSNFLFFYFTPFSEVTQYMSYHSLLIVFAQLPSIATHWIRTHFLISLPSTVNLLHFVQYLNFCPVSPLPFHFVFSIHFWCYLFSFCYTRQKTVLKHNSYYQIYQVACLECSNTTRMRIAITATWSIHYKFLYTYMLSGFQLALL